MRRCVPWLAALFLASEIAWADPIGSTITYQGRLTEAGAPVSGSYDFEFALFTVANGGDSLDTLALDDQSVDSGMINASLDFTEVPFDGQALWVEVRLRPGAAVDGYTTLLPRQLLNATPYALYALSGNPGPSGPPGNDGPPGIQGPPGALALPYTATNASTSSVSVTNTSAGGTALLGTASATSGNGAGVRGFADGTQAVGVLGVNSSGPGVNGRSTGSPGVVGESTNSRGVFGYSANGIAGVYGQSITGDGVVAISTDRHGVYAETSALSYAAVTGSNMVGVGVQGYGRDSAAVYGSGKVTAVVGWSTDGNGVGGHSTGTGGINNGVSGTSQFGNGVIGFSNQKNGVHGESSSPTFAGVEGDGLAAGYGVMGRCFGASCFGVFAFGQLGATGAKSFVEPHPTDASKQITYISLEGREAGTYFRGSGRLVDGRATIVVPEDFAMVTSEQGLTVQLTSIGQFAGLYLVTTNLQHIEVAGSADVEFNYHVNGVRKAFAGHEPIAANVLFVPSSAADASRLAASLPAESVRRLIANGTLNADLSVNAATARRLGWDQRAGWNDPPRATGPIPIPEAPREE